MPIPGEIRRGPSKGDDCLACQKPIEKNSMCVYWEGKVGASFMKALQKLIRVEFHRECGRELVAAADKVVSEAGA